MGDTIWLQRPTGDVPWGFRISGGRDFQEPIRVSRVSGGSIASSSLVNGDVLLRIGNSEASCLTHSQANDIIKNSGNTLQLCVVKGNTSDSAQNTQGPQFSTKLEQQLANMDLSYGGSNPTTPQSPYAPSIRGYQSPSAPQQPNYQHSPHSQNSPGYHPLANIPPPPSHQPMQNNYSPMSPTSHMQQHSPGQKVPPKVPEKPAMPDAVLNMAAKGGTDKKPFAYAADMDEIKHHREKVRRKPVGIPSYQNILNLPQFDDPPASTKLKPYHPPAPKYEPETPPIPAGPGDGVVSHAQYNTPLGLYSSENAEEAFKAQSGGLVTGVDGLPGTKEKKDITESATYKMIHGISAPKPKPKITVPAHTSNHPPRGPAPDDEMTFSGVLRPTDIPSKSFHRLQSLTDHGGGSEIDRTSIRPNQHLGDDEGVGGYDEASIRYLGKNIPSRSFRMLQSMTGGSDLPIPGPTKRHQHRKRDDIEPEEPEKHNDEIVDISYVGGNIPSRSFKMLQQQIGESNDTTSRPPPGPHPNHVGRTVKVVKLRSAQPTHTDLNGATDF